MSRTVRWRRIIASHQRHHTIGPASYLRRLKNAALGDHRCRPYLVRITP